MGTHYTAAAVAAEQLFDRNVSGHADRSLFVALQPGECYGCYNFRLEMPPASSAVQYAAYATKYQRVKTGVSAVRSAAAIVRG